MDQSTQQAVTKGAAGTAASVAAIGMTFQEWLQLGIVVMTFVWWGWLFADKVRERKLVEMLTQKVSSAYRKTLLTAQIWWARISGRAKD